MAKAMGVGQDGGRRSRAERWWDGSGFGVTTTDDAEQSALGARGGPGLRRNCPTWQGELDQ
jgi:hypothetical protein